ncbi:MAG: sulfate reduction electron transfer complex DsrMKJOP subunit DsrJ [Desulfovibrionaceae bacterium]
MYNGKYIIPGIIVFVVLMTAPFWLNAMTSSYKRPELKLPVGEKACVESTEFMRAEHMQLLDTWRDQVVRERNREYTNAEGKKFDISLQNTCMKCHSNKAEFCDKCHETNSVAPYCFTCHLEPKGNN